MTTPDLTRLERAAAGLLLPSESDEPIGVVRWDGGGKDLEDADVVGLAGRGAGAKVERTDVDDVFRDAFAGQAAPRFHQLVKMLESTLDAIRVYRVGEVEKDVFILGKIRVGGGWAGLRSKVVET